jgi:hypothetical protein
MDDLSVRCADIETVRHPASLGNRSRSLAFGSAIESLWRSQNRWGGSKVLTGAQAKGFLLTFVLSWSYWGLALGLQGREGLWRFLPGAFAPAVAAVAVTGLAEGRPGVRAYMRRFVI